VLLVGGSSKMPQVARRLRDELGVEPEMREPDLAVAKGAALYGEMLTEDRDAGDDRSGGIRPAREWAVDSTPVGDVCPKGFGLLVLSSETDELVVDCVVDKDQALPASTERTYVTLHSDQRSVESAIYEQVGSAQSDRPDDNKKIIDYAITDIPAGYPADTPIEVKFWMDVSGLIRVTAKHPGKDEPLVVEVHVGGGGPSLEESREKLKGILVR